MSLLRRLLAPVCGNLPIDPDDLPAYFRLAHAVQQAEREGNDGLSQLWSAHGIRDREHWRAIVIAMGARHGRDATFVREASRLFASEGRRPPNSRSA